MPSGALLARRLLRVGPAFDLKTPSQASRVAQDGDRAVFRRGA